MDCNKSKNVENCPCTYDGCPRKGACCECIAHHLKQRQLPACCFPAEAEKTMDRSFQHFADLVATGRV